MIMFPSYTHNNFINNNYYYYNDNINYNHHQNLLIRRAFITLGTSNLKYKVIPIPYNV